MKPYKTTLIKKIKKSRPPRGGRGLKHLSKYCQWLERCVAPRAGGVD